VKALMQGVSILSVSPLWVMINVIQFRVSKVTRELLIFKQIDETFGTIGRVNLLICKIFGFSVF
jgi:hypothetical protein